MGIIKLKKTNEEEVIIKKEDETKEFHEISDPAAREANFSVCEEKLEQWEDPAVLREDEEHINAHSRHYVLNNNTTKSVFSGEPVNYYDEEGETWKKIDNSLIETENGFEAGFGKFKTTVLKAEKGKKVEIEGDGLSLSWEYLGKALKAAAEINEADISLLTLQNTTEEKAETILCVEKSLKGAANSTASRAVYENAESDTDIEYRLSGNNVKENIIVKERAEEYKYLFALNTKGLRMRLSDDNMQLELYSETEKEGGEIEEKLEFTIPSPYMYDAEGESCEDVYYELEPETDGKYVFAVVASEEWINAEERAFPVTIDPQIITDNTSFFDFKNYRKSRGSGSSSGPSSWSLYGNSSEFVVGIDFSSEYKSSVCIKKSNIVNLYGRIASVILKLKASMVYTPGAFRVGDKEIYCNSTSTYLSIDITNAYKANGGDFDIELLPSSKGYGNGAGDLKFNATGINAPILEIKYLTNESTRPTKRSFSLAGAALGTVDLATQDVTVEFTDVPGEDSVMGLGIFHVYKKSGEENFAGENFRLNLNENFIKYSAGEGENVDYIYTDEKGDKYGFWEYYYYKDSANNKVYVSGKKSDFTIDADGRLKDKDNREIFAEYKSMTGLTAVTRFEGFENYHLLEQRSDEYKQLEEQVKSYENAYKEFVLLNTATGNDDPLATEKIFGSYNYDEMPIPKSEALQYKSVLNQQRTLNKKYGQATTMVPDVNPNKDTDLIAKSGTIEAPLASLKTALEEISEKLIKYINNCTAEDGADTKRELCNLINNNLEVYPDHYQFLTAYYCKYPEFRDSNRGEIDGTPKLTGAALHEMFRQRNLMLLQLEEQTNELLTQKKIVDGQITWIKEKKSQYIAQVQSYYKEYVNKSAQLEQMKRQMPINFLTDGKIIKGYNENGRLVSVYDNRDNYAVIEYEKTDVTTDSPLRISRIYDKDGKEVRFSYNPQSKLTEITDTRGRKTRYEYSGSKLSKVKYDSGTEFTISYSNNNIKSITEAKNALKTNLSYLNNQLRYIYNYSTIDGIPKTNISEELSLISSIVITYTQATSTGANTVTVTEENHAEKYIFDVEGNCTGHYTSENGIVTEAEEYEYEPYWKWSEKQSNPRSVTKYAQRDSLNKTPMSSFTFTAEVTETTTLDQFNNPLKTMRSGIKVTADGSNQQTTVVDYTYDDDQKLREEKRTVSYTNPSKTIISYKKYRYNGYGEITRTESYVEGEEKTKGKTIEETEYDEKGNVVKSIEYNSLDSSSKFYKESEYAENGRIVAEKDETGENKRKYEYVCGTNIVRTEVLPNGSKVSYGQDEEERVTGITQSTEEGEGNSNSTSYTYGEVTEVRSGNNVVEYEYDYKRRLTSVKVNPNSATDNYISYEYTELKDSAGKKTGEKITATYKKRAEGITADKIEKTLDVNGNVLSVKVNGEPQTENIYTSDNKISLVTDEITGKKYRYRYDDLGRLTNYEVLNSEGTYDGYAEELKYDKYGKLGSKAVFSSTDFPGCDYYYKENAARDLDFMWYDRKVIIRPKTDVLGRNIGKTVMLPGGRAEEIITYRKVGDHATQMPSTIRYGDNTGGEYGIRDCLKYAYDEMGNIAKVYENGELSVRYTYDKLSRLIREDNKSLGETYLFDYDNNGNILTKRTLAFTLKGKEEVEELSSTAKEYTYDRDRLLSYNGETFVYDGLGNPTTYRGKTLTWSKGRQLTNYNRTAFAYNGQGQRISKGNISYIYGSDGNLVSQSDGLSFMYDATGVVGIKYDNKYYAFRKDILGNVIGILDENGINIVQYRYDAWGICKIEKDTSGKNLGELNPFRYRGYYYDTETKLYYLKTRYYDPEIGRFITIDDVTYLAPDTINGLNLYAYCNNNPVMNVDPEGTSWWSKFWRTIAVVGLAALVVGAIAAITFVTGGAVAPILIGAGIGFATSGVISGITQFVTTGNIDWAQLVVDMAFGAVTGAFGGSTLGILGMTVAGGATGFAGSVASDFVAGRDIQWGMALTSAVIGAAFGALSGGGAQHGKNVTLKSKLSLRNQKKAMGKPLTAVNAQIKNERALLSILGCKALMPNEELFYDFILEYVVYTVLPVIYNRGRI